MFFFLSDDVVADLRHFVPKCLDVPIIFVRFWLAGQAS